MKCAHCGKAKAEAAWDYKLCADTGRWKVARLCEPCDAELNGLVMAFLNVPQAEAKLRAYRGER